MSCSSSPKSILNTLTKDDFNDARLWIHHGVCMQCFALLSQNHIFEALHSEGGYDFSISSTIERDVALKQAVDYLSAMGVIIVTDYIGRFSRIGKALSAYRGVIDTLSIGYGSLICKKLSQPTQTINDCHSFIHGKVVSQSSIQYGRQWVAPILKKQCLLRPVQGRVCDLGCGMCSSLIDVCDYMDIKGVGIDDHKDVVDQARLILHNKKGCVSIECDDVFNMKVVHPQIKMLMQQFVFHDCVPTDMCICVLRDYHELFPDMEYFYYVDIVAGSNCDDERFPGFEFVHSLMGKTMRSYEETVAMFKEAKYSIDVEESIEGLPQTFLWVLTPDRKRDC